MLRDRHVQVYSLLHRHALQCNDLRDVQGTKSFIAENKPYSSAGHLSTCYTSLHQPPACTWQALHHACSTEPHASAAAHTRYQYRKHKDNSVRANTFTLLSRTGQKGRPDGLVSCVGPW